MRLQTIMAAVRKGTSGTLERVPSAGVGGRNKPKGTPIRALHPNSSPVYKTQSDTALTSGLRNLTLKDKKLTNNVIKRPLSGKANGNLTVKTVADAASLLQGETISNVVVVAGAGISTPSGIPDFRSPGTGLYDNLQQYQIPYPEAIFDIDYFFQNPRPFFTLAKELYPSGKYRPNYIHYFVRLLHDKGKLLRMYTQNIDGLERLAGVPPEKLVEAHGTFATATCTTCRQKMEGSAIKDKIFSDKLPRCPTRGCVGIVKPDIVFFGEDLPRKFYSYMKDMLQADMVIVMGTSLEVQPFAGIVDTVRYNVPRILFNREAVGPFRHGKRTQDVVAAGDLIERMVKFSGMVGWKEDMMELITQQEGEFKLINHKPPPPPVNQKRNYSSLAYRGRAYESSSEEESSDSETEESSSDSSDDGGKNRRTKGLNKGNIRNGITRTGAPLRNGFRASSAKVGEGNKRKFHTAASPVGRKDVSGNLTGRSVKSESGVNINEGKRKLDNQKPNANPKKNSLAKANSVTNENKSQVTKEERERVLRKYGLSPGPKIVTSAVSNAAVKPRENVTAVGNVHKTEALDSDKENTAGQVKKDSGDSAVVGAYFVDFDDEKENMRKTKTSAEEKVLCVGNNSKNETNDVYQDTQCSSLTENNQFDKLIHDTELKINPQLNDNIVTDPAVEKAAEVNLMSINTDALADNSEEVKHVQNDEQTFTSENTLTYNENGCVENLENNSNSSNNEPDSMANHPYRLSLIGKRNEVINVPVGRVAHIGEKNKLLNALPGHGVNREANKLSDENRAIRNFRSSSQNSDNYGRYTQTGSVYSEGSISSRNRSKLLSEKAAKSFAKYANLTPTRQVFEENTLKNIQRGKKPPTGIRVRVQAQELREVNARPYGFESRQKLPGNRIGAFHCAGIRPSNSSIEYAEAILRAGSAELPRISYRHKSQPPKLFKPQVQLDSYSTNRDAWTGDS